MTYTYRLLGLGLLAATMTFAQNVHNGDLSVLGNFSASSGTSTAPMKTVISDPSGTCSVPSAMVLNVSGGSQAGHMSACIGGAWQLVGGGQSLAAPGVGIVKSNGTSLLNATAGIDYQAPLTFPLSLANGGTGVSSAPTLTGGSGIQVSGQWPAWTVTNIGGGGGGGGTSGNATSIQGNVVKTGTPSLTGQAYLWSTANNDFEIGTIASTLATTGSGNFVESVSPTLITPSFGQSGPTITYVTDGSVTANKLVSIDSSGRVLLNTTGGNGLGLAATTVSGAGNSVEVQMTGLGQCVMDGAATIGHIAVSSSTIAGDCADSGYSLATSVAPTVAVVGMIGTSSTQAGQLSRIQLQGPNQYGTNFSTGGGGGGNNSGSGGTINAAGAGIQVVQTTGGGSYTVNAVDVTNKTETAVLNYSIAQSDQDKYILFSGSGTANWVIPSATSVGSGNFGDGWMTTVCNIGSGTLNLTPQAASTINGTTAATAISGCAIVHSDGVNYQLIQSGSGGGGGGGGGTVTAPLTLSYASAAGGGGGVITIANTTATGYTTFIMQGTAHSYQVGVGGGSVTGGLANRFYIYDQTNSGSISQYDPATGNWYYSNTGNVVIQNGSLNEAVATVTYSATPSFDFSNGNLLRITLTGNVSSSTINSLAVGQYTFQVCQDATGSRTFAWPTNVHGGMTIGSTASKCSTQTFASFDGATLYASSTGVSNQ